MSHNTLPHDSESGGPPIPGFFSFSPPRRPYWLHALLFLLTIFTTLVVGARLQERFLAGQPMFLADESFFPIDWALRQPSRLLMGAPFAAALMGILLAHEMGHFVYSVRNRVYATLPFFLPAPTPIGTFGAFIQIKSSFRSRAALFDIAIAGPIAGFVIAVPSAFLGLLLSKPLPASPAAILDMGQPLIFQLLHSALKAAGIDPAANVPLSQFLLHPIAIAAWIGMLATALNLLPGGQLDGGHIVYALAPRAHRKITRIAMLALVPLGIFSWSGWLIWIVGLKLTMRHPYVPEWPPLNAGRKALAWAGFAMLALTLVPQPFHDASIYEVVKALL